MCFYINFYCLIFTLFYILTIFFLKFLRKFWHVVFGLIWWIKYYLYFTWVLCVQKNKIMLTLASFYEMSWVCSTQNWSQVSGVHTQTISLVNSWIVRHIPFKIKYILVGIYCWLDGYYVFIFLPGSSVSQMCSTPIHIDCCILVVHQLLHLL